MNSLVSSILIISSVLSLGYGFEFPVRSDNHIQKTEINPILTKTEPLPINDLRESNINDWLRDSLNSFVEINLSATEWDWKIRRPGVFCSEVMQCWVNSPYDILVDFEGFANFTNIISANSQINTSYAISQPVPPPPRSEQWISAKNLNLADFIIPGGNALKWNLWSLVDVTNDNSAAEYENRPTINFILLGVTDYIEPELSFQRSLRYLKNKQQNVNQ